MGDGPRQCGKKGGQGRALEQFVRVSCTETAKALGEHASSQPGGEQGVASKA